MLNLKRHMRGFSRLMIGLFAVQILAMGFCLMAPAGNVSAMPMSPTMAPSSHMTANCDQHMKTETDTSDQHAACAHCDLPGELISSKVSTFNIDLPVVACIATTPDLTAALHIDFIVHPATGPPPSVPLLFHNNQRILI